MKFRSRGTALIGGAAIVALGIGGAVAVMPTASAADVLLSRNKPVTASSSGGCCAPANAVDGNAATRWASASNIDPSWIYVDLGSTASISRVRLQWDLSCATAYQVQTSADKNTWTSVYTTATGDGGVDDITGLTASGRYVRMLGTQRCRSDATHGYSLQEFDVYGSSTGGDTQPPSAPGMPTLVGKTATSVTISWPASTDNVAVAGYDVFRDGQLSASVDAKTLQATVSGLSPNTQYGFYVNARDTSGNNSQPSPTLQVTTDSSGDTQPPTAPGNLHSTGVTSTSISLAWNAATDNVGVTGYNVYSVAANGTLSQVGSSTGLSTVISGRSPSTAYTFVAKAVDGNKNEGPASNQITVSTSGGSCTTPICTVTQVGTDNDVVWGLVELPDGNLLYNHRDAHDIALLDPRTGTKKSIGTVPNVQSTDGEGGLTGLEINPVSFPTDHWLYIMHTSPTDNRVVRIKYENGVLNTASEQVLVTGIARNKFHDGGRLRFSPDGKYLFASTGDGQNGARAQDLSSLNGKVLRMNPDGSIPADNPFKSLVWSYGHRNPQGLAFDSKGNLWEQEFGNSIMDETNLIVKGGNYGWPSCEGTSGTCGTAGFIAPKRTYPVGSGSCSGIAIVRDVLYVACQRGTRLVRAVISNNNLTNVQEFFNGTYGRLRTVEPTHDGNLWLATTNGGDKDSTPNNSTNKIFKVTLGS
jgi:glucose/arabinose dehydrogenase